MTDDGMFSIGDLARRTGLPVRTIRFYSEIGVVPESARSPAGYRRYDHEAVTRLDLVRTLRELGLPLETIRALLAAQTSMSQVAAAHVDKLDLQIRTLRLRRAVLRAVAKTETTAQEAVFMHKLVTMSEPERQRLIDDFLDEAFGGLDANPDLVALLRNMRPELPDDPEPEQVGAWVELAELVQDPDFRSSVRRMAEFQAAERADGDHTGLHHELTIQVIEQVQAAIAADVGAPPHRLPLASWTTSSPHTRGPSTRRTMRRTGPLSCIVLRWRRILEPSGTWSCLPRSTDGRHNPISHPCSTGSLARCVPTSPRDPRWGRRTPHGGLCLPQRGGCSSTIHRRGRSPDQATPLPRVIGPTTTLASATIMAARAPRSGYTSRGRSIAVIRPMCAYTPHRRRP